MLVEKLRLFTQIINLTNMVLLNWENTKNFQETLRYSLNKLIRVFENRAVQNIVFWVENIISVIFFFQSNLGLLIQKSLIVCLHLRVEVNVRTDWMVPFFLYQLSNQFHWNLFKILYWGIFYGNIACLCNIFSLP